MEDILYESEETISSIAPLPLGGSGMPGFSMDGFAFDFVDPESGGGGSGSSESSHVFVT
jgi:hypothetical protein